MSRLNQQAAKILNRMARRNPRHIGACDQQCQAARQVIADAIAACKGDNTCLRGIISSLNRTRKAAGLSQMSPSGLGSAPSGDG